MTKKVKILKRQNDIIFIRKCKNQLQNFTNYEVNKVQFELQIPIPITTSL